MSRVTETPVRPGRTNRLLSAVETNPDMYLMETVDDYLHTSDEMTLEPLRNALGTTSGLGELLLGVSERHEIEQRRTCSASRCSLTFRRCSTARTCFGTQATGLGFETWATESMSWAELSNITEDTYDNADVDFGFTTQWDSTRAPPAVRRRGHVLVGRCVLRRPRQPRRPDRGATDHGEQHRGPQRPNMMR